ncbi:MAG: glycosyltransferase family 39 protein [Bacteroidales bacterium]|nr:glycosyltransferase family 39 protein [Bacteroidales bacterium]
MNRKTLTILLIASVGALLFIPFLGVVHLFDWDEINFAESAREMLLTHNYLTVQINFLPFWEKPPLFIWMQVLAMKVFGINAFAARFPNAIVGIVTLITVYLIGEKLFSHKFGLLWALVYAGSILPQMYFHSGIIDPWFNLFIFLGIYYMVLYLSPDIKRNKNWLIFLSAASIGLGILTKGPVALLDFLLALAVWLIIDKSWKKVFNLRFLLIYGITLLLVGGFWFILQILSGKAYLILEFIQYQIRLFSQKDAGHGGFLMYHFVVLFIGVFPASIFALAAFRKFKDQNITQKLFRNWMMISFWVVLILFTIVKTKIIHYSSFCYFPLTFLATYAIMKIAENKLKFGSWLKTILIVMTILEGSALIGLQLFVKYKDQIIAKDWIKDPFAVGNLQAVVHWSGYEFLLGVMLIAGIILSLILFRKQFMKQVVGIFITSLIYTTLTIFIITPKIEQYSQNAAIQFYQEHAGQDCYMRVWGFKSYAQYFYFKKQPPENGSRMDEESLLENSVNKPVYVVTKITSYREFEKRYPEFTLMYIKNGFAFFGKPAFTPAKKINTQ